MGYVDRILQRDEQVLGVGHMHWIVFARGALLLIVALAIFVLAPSAGAGRNWGNVGAVIFALFGILSLLRNAIEVWTTEIVVTDRRVIHKRGLIRRETGEMNMAKVESVIVDQSIPGRLLGYGSIVVRGTGAGIEGLHHIANPLPLRTAIVAR